MYKLNDIAFDTYGITPGRVSGEGIAVRGIFDLPKRISDTEHSWDDEDGEEAFVAADELFFAGRTILFHGILVGTAAAVKANLDAFKSAIAAFVNVVPLETPYGNACVYIKKIDTKTYNGGATILIEFQEPEVGASCGINTEITVYESEEYTGTAVRNNCDFGFYGSEVTLTAAAGQFTSTISQAAANQLAIDWVLDNIQDHANVTGTCIINPTVYYNVRLEATLQRDDCAEGYEGSTETYVVEAYTYSSLISQEDADAQAQAELDENFTQEIVNATGVCRLIYYNEEISGEVQKNNCAPGYIGTFETFTIPAGTYQSTLSQAYANALAQAAFNTGAQAYANSNGYCANFDSNDFKIIEDVNNPVSSQRIYKLKISSDFPFPVVYNIKFREFDGSPREFYYSYEAAADQTKESVTDAIRNELDGFSTSDWNDLVGGTMYGSSGDYPELQDTGSNNFRIYLKYNWRITDVWLTV